MNFDDINVNIEMTARQAMRLMTILILSELSFEEQRAELSKNVILKDDLNEINEIIELCKFLMNEIDKKIINSIDKCSERERKERLKSLVEEIKSTMGGN